MSVESSSELPNTSLLYASLRWTVLIAGASFLFAGVVIGALVVANVTSAPKARDNGASGTVDSPAKTLLRPANEVKQKS